MVTDSKKFAGIFDCNNHTVTNLCIKATANDAGLFGATVAGFAVTDLTLANVNITSTKSYVDCLVSVLRGNVEKCSIEGLSLQGISLAVELFNILPNILYFEQSGQLTAAVENVLHGVFVPFDTIRPIYNLHFESDIGINGLLYGLLADVVEDTDFELPEDESVLNFIVGNVSKKLLQPVKPFMLWRVQVQICLLLFFIIHCRLFSVK